jgi:multidrug efflux system membrane fusion protein
MTAPLDQGTLANIRGAFSEAGAGRIARWRRWGVLSGALVLVLGGYWFFNNRDKNGPPRAAAAPVRVAIVEQRDMIVIERSLGTVVPNTMVQINARVAGTLESAQFHEGDFVRKDDVLFQIDPRPFQAALAGAQAVWRRDQAQLINAMRDRQRYQTLHDQGAISTQQRDVSGTNADVMAATVAADKAAVDAAALNLGYTQIRSPVNGKTGPILIQPGNMIATASPALVTIAEVRPVKISFTLPQTDLPKIQARQAEGKLIAVLDARDRKGNALTAPVNFVSNAVSNQSGTIELRATIANDDLSLVPGELVNVTVQLGDIPRALVVPREAVNDSPNGSFAYVVKNGRAEQRPVTLTFDDGKYASISGDLAAGDAVVTEGQLRVTPGGAVHVLGAAKAGGGLKAGRAAKRKRPQ